MRRLCMGVGAIEDVPRAPAPDRRAALRLPLALAATALACLPMLVALGRALGQHTSLPGDSALIDVAVRDVWTAHPPLVGTYSRVGFYHPGPLLYYLIAPVSLLFGRAEWATVLGIVLLQMLAVVWSAKLAWKRGGLLMVLLVLAVISASYLTLRNSDPLTVPWNPYVAFPFFVLFVLQTWTIATGDRGKVPGAIFVGSLLIQAHVGYLALVGVGVAWWLVPFVRSRKQEPDRWRRTAVIGAVVGFVVWLPPLVDLVIHGARSNPVALFDYFVRSKHLPTIPLYPAPAHRRLGWTVTSGIFATELRLLPLPPWLGGSLEPSGSLDATIKGSAWWLLFAVALSGVTFVVARRRADRNATNATLLVALLTVTGVASMLAARGGPAADAFLWRATLAILVFATAGAVIFATSRAGARPAARAITGVILAVAVAVPVGVTTSVVLDPSTGYGTTTRTVSQLLQQVAATGIPRHTHIMLSGDLAYSGPVFDALYRAGYSVGVTPSMSRYWFSRQHSIGLAAAQTVWCVAGQDNLSRLALLRGAHVVAMITPFDRAEEQEYEALQARAYHILFEASHLRFVPYLTFPNLVPRLDEVPGFDAPMLARLAALDRELAAAHYRRFGIVALTPRQLASTRICSAT